MNILGDDYTLVTLDFETYYGTGYSLSLQTMNTFKYVADEQFLIHGVGVKIDENPTEYFDFHSNDDYCRFNRLIDRLRSQRVALACHNTGFDGFILHYHYDYHPDLYIDTLSMSRGMFVGQQASLEALAIRLWPSDPTKRKGKELESTRNLRELPEGIRSALRGYCIQDVDLTYAAAQLMVPAYPDDELRLIDWTIRAQCDPVFEVDLDLINDEIEHQVAIREAAIKRACNEFNITEARLKSDKQFKEFLEARGIEIPLKRNAKDTDDIPALGQKDWGYQKMVARHPELSAVWEARKLAKSNIQESRARWFKAVAEWNDGKMPIALNYYGADTGRWSGGEKLNQQNLPRNNNGDVITDPNSGRLRRSLLAPAGSVVVVRDLSNIEGRMLAWEANEMYLLDLFANDGCPYLAMAEAIFNKPRGSMNKKDHAFERQVGKAATLGLGYNMGANKFWVTVNTGASGTKMDMPFNEAQRIVNIYRTVNSNITRFWRDCDAAITLMASLNPGETRDFGPLTLTCGMAILPNGMALQYPGLHGEPNAFGGYNFTFGNNKSLYGGLLCENITQALARVLLGQQMLTVQAELDANYGRDVARIVHSVHDEMIVIAPEQYGDEIYTMMGEVMSKSPDWAPTLPLKSEGGVAREYSK